MDHLLVERQPLAQVATAQGFVGGSLGSVSPTETGQENIATILAQTVQDNSKTQALLSTLEDTLGVPPAPTSAGDAKSTVSITTIARVINSQAWDINARVNRILHLVGKIG